MSRDEIERILTAHRADLEARGVQSLAIFGSAARGEAGPESDVDILVELDPEAHVGLLGLVGLKEYLETVLDRSVDVVTSEGLRAWMRERVVREAVRVV